MSSEFGVFLTGAAKDPAIIELLTKLYDCEMSFDYHTIARGKEFVGNVWCGLLAATTPEWLQLAMPYHAIGGGFTSRIVFVYQREPEKLIPFPKLTPKMLELQEVLADGLKEMAKLKGRVELTKDAKEWFEDWYCEVFRAENVPAELQGYYGRKHDLLLKVAVLVAVSDRMALVVNDEDLAVALRVLNENEKAMFVALQSIQTSEGGMKTKRIESLIRSKGEIAHSKLLQTVSHSLGAKELAEIIETLKQMGKVEEVIRGKGRWYRWKK